MSMETAFILVIVLRLVKLVSDFETLAMPLVYKDATPRTMSF
jgi:hypothetical protein